MTLQEQKEIEEFNENLLKGYAKISSENYYLQKEKDKVIQFIKNNFTNEDGEIWHSDMQIIYNILNKEEI